MSAFSLTLRWNADAYYQLCIADRKVMLACLLSQGRAFPSRRCSFCQLLLFCSSFTGCSSFLVLIFAQRVKLSGVHKRALRALSLTYRLKASQVPSVRGQAMDYSRVAPPFKQYALLMQIVLTAALVLYAGYCIMRIRAQTDHPHMEVSLRHFRNAGMWRLCPIKDIELDGVGLALPPDQDDRKPRDFNSSAEADALNLVYQQTADVVASEQGAFTGRCTIVDLTRWKLPKPPVVFHICYDAQTYHTHLSVATGSGEVARSRWYETVGFTPIPHQILALLVSKHGYGFEDVFSSTYSEIWKLAKQAEWIAPHMNFSTSCPSWKRMRPSSGRETVIKIFIVDSAFDVAMAQSPLKQTLSLLSDIGGYMSLMTALFVAVWVRRYPHGEVAPLKRARLLVMQRGSKMLSKGWWQKLLTRLAAWQRE